MKKIIILGANGKIAQIVRKRILNETGAHLSLYLRNSNRIKNINPNREEIIDGDVNDFNKLNDALKDKDIVYANLGGRFEPMAKNIIKAMQKNNNQRLIYVTGLGLYHEVPGDFGKWVEKSIGKEIMDDTRRAAKIIEKSSINYTIIRAAYMNNESKISYETTQKGTFFKGCIVSRASIADYIIRLVKNSSLDNYASVGINEPGTDGVLL
ncbi:NAD(P)H-binding protein [Apilactobacillus ozensis]|nr:NAD(P)H-binding protein [Apilactobacillus ozensis]